MPHRHRESSTARHGYHESNLDGRLNRILGYLKTIAIDRRGWEGTRSLCWVSQELQLDEFHLFRERVPATTSWSAACRYPEWDYIYHAQSTRTRGHVEDGSTGRIQLSTEACGGYIQL